MAKKITHFNIQNLPRPQMVINKLERGLNYFMGGREYGRIQDERARKVEERMKANLRERGLEEAGRTFFGRTKYRKIK